MAEPNDGIRSEGTREDPSYRISEQIPRDSLYFRVAQLEQLSRIRYESAYDLMGQASVLEVKPRAIQHAREAEFSEKQISEVEKVFNRLKKYEDNLNGACDKAKADFLTQNPNINKENLEGNIEWNKYLAGYLFRDLFERNPTGELRVFFCGNIGVCFVYDHQEDFPYWVNSRNKTASGAGTIRMAKGYEDEYLRSRSSRYRALTFFVSSIPQDLGEAEKSLDANNFFSHEFDHTIRHILEEEFIDGGYSDDKGTRRLKDRYVKASGRGHKFGPSAGEETIDKELIGLGMTVRESYTGAKDEVLAVLAEMADYMYNTGEGRDFSAVKVVDRIMKDYDFLGISTGNKHYEEATGALRRCLVEAINAYEFIVYDIYQSDFVFTSGIFEMFDITRWPALATAIKEKTERYGLPSFMQ